jgi:preprotein translocase subunit YajC
VGAAIYFLMVRPQRKRTAEQKAAYEKMGPGSRVMTIGGIIGTVRHWGDKQAIIEVSPGVEITVLRQAISTQKVEDEFEYVDEDVDVHLVAEEDEIAPPASAQTPEDAPETPAEPSPTEDLWPKAEGKAE